MNIRDIVLRHFAAIVTEFSPVPFPDNVTDDMRLDEFWLDSITLVELMSRLEKAVGYVPSTLLEGAFYPATFGAFVALYEDAANRSD